MKKQLIYTLILAALAALTASCAQPFVAPASQDIGEGAGRVVLKVSVGETSTRTVLPKTVPAFSRYEVEFSSIAATVPVADTSDIAGEGVSQELDAGTWTITVRAYRSFAPAGETETEYLAARGSAEVAVIAGQVASVTIPLAPVPITDQDAALKGIFTYTVTFPDDAAASLTLSNGGATITKTPVSGTKASVELAAGYYDLAITLTKTAGTATFTAGAAEKAHIYSGLESEAVYAFTDADFVRIIPFAGTLDLPAGVSLSSGTIGVYSDSAYTDLVVSAALPEGGTRWALGVPASYAGSTLYFKLDALDSAWNTYNAAASRIITGEGDGSFSLSVSVAVPVVLTHSERTEGEITSPGQVDYYQFTVENAGSYCLQLESANNVASLLVFRADGTQVKLYSWGEYKRTESVSAGETFYAQVTGVSAGSTGTYALHYTGLPYPSHFSALGIPKPAVVVSWDNDFVNVNYNIYRSESAEGPFTLAGQKPGSSYYVDTAVTAGTTYYYKIAAVSTKGGASGDKEGALSAVVSAAPYTGSVTSLTHNVWAEETISSPGEKRWYQFTAGPSDATYSLQWDDANRGSGTKTLDVYVSAYRSGNGAPIFDGTADNGYVLPRIFYAGQISPDSYCSIDPGETVYVLVEGVSAGSTGSYALRYYDPLATTPNTFPYVAVQGNPAPACLVKWHFQGGTSVYGPGYGTTGYKLYRSTSAEGPYTLLATLNSGDSPYYYTDTTVTAGTAYYYRVSAVNGYGEGPLSDPAFDTPPAAAGMPLTVNVVKEAALSVPYEVHHYTFTAEAAGIYYVQWTDADDMVVENPYADIYVSVFRSDGSVEITPAFDRLSRDEEVFYNLTYDYYYNPIVLDAGETIYLRVIAYPIGADSTGLYKIQCYTIAAPTNVRVEATSDPGCVVSWDPVPGATGYHLYSATSPEGPYLSPYPYGLSAGWMVTEDLSTKISSNSDPSRRVSSGTTYYYKVTAVNYLYEGLFSEVVSCTPWVDFSDAAPLTPGVWSEGDLIGNWKDAKELSLEYDRDWHAFTAETAGTYSVEWEHTPGSVLVSVYRDDKIAVFERCYQFQSPLSISADAGETLYVLIEGAGYVVNGSRSAATYKLRYYQ